MKASENGLVHCGSSHIAEMSPRVSFRNIAWSAILNVASEEKREHIKTNGKGLAKEKQNVCNNRK